MNVVTESEGRGAAVLIRAIEPVWGIESMMAARGQTDLRKLTRGPGMLCQALSVDRQQDGLDLVTDADMQLVFPESDRPRNVVRSQRIGISKAKSRKLRFVDAESPFVSRKP